MNEFETDDDFCLTIEDIIKENNKVLGIWDRIQPTNQNSDLVVLEMEDPEIQAIPN